MKNTLKLFFIIGMTILLFFINIGCSQKNEEIKIGVINSLTGPAGSLGKNIQNGIDLAVNEINDNGGIKGKKIQLFIEDDATDSKKAISAFAKLVDVDKVPVIIGPASSGGVMSCAPLANKKEIVLLSPGAGSPSISQAGPYVFRNRVSGDLDAKTIAKFVAEKLNMKNVAILKINTDYGVGFSEVFKKIFTELGGNIIDEETFNQGDVDFRKQIIKLKSLNPDGIYMVGVPRECGLILKQSKELGLTKQFFANNIESDELFDVAGGTAENLIIAISAYAPNQSDKTHKFNEKYFESYNKQSDMFAADGYDAVYLIKYAIEHDGQSGTEIRRGLMSIHDFNGVNGIINFDDNGDVVKDLVIKKVINGKFITYDK